MFNTARLVEDEAADTVQKLRQQPAKDLMIFGSGGLVSTLAPLGLIDEYRIIVNPVILGQGTPMFRSIRNKIKLRLVASRPFESGIVMLTYLPEVTA